MTAKEHTNVLFLSQSLKLSLKLTMELTAGRQLAIRVWLEVRLNNVSFSSKSR